MRFDPDFEFRNVIEDVGGVFNAGEGHGGGNSDEDFDRIVADGGFSNVFFKSVWVVRDGCACRNRVEGRVGVARKKG